MFQCGGNVQNFSPDFLSSFCKTLNSFLESKIRAKTLSRDWFPHTLDDDFRRRRRRRGPRDKEDTDARPDPCERAELRFRRPRVRGGARIARRQRRWRKRVRTSQVRPFFFDDTRGCISSFWRGRRGEDRELTTRTTRRSFARILRATPKSAKCSCSQPSLFFYLRFCRAFFCVRETSVSRRRKNPPTTPACDLSFRRHEKQVPGV